MKNRNECIRYVDNGPQSSEEQYIIDAVNETDSTYDDDQSDLQQSQTTEKLQNQQNHKGKPFNKAADHEEAIALEDLRTHQNAHSTNDHIQYFKQYFRNKLLVAICVIAIAVYIVLQIDWIDVNDYQTENLNK